MKRRSCCRTGWIGSLMADDYFKRAPGGAEYAGDHILMDLFGAAFLADPAYIQQIMRVSCRLAGAKVISEKYHHFGTGQGVSGMTILAESHASIHTWPERGFASVDIFMCGSGNPARAAELIRKFLVAKEYTLTNVRRGEAGAERKSDYVKA